MKQCIFRVAEVTELTANVRRMVLTGDTSGISRAGQFVNIRLDGRFLRRPISVCDYDGQSLTLIFKLAGAGTEQLAELAPGAELDILTGLGNGYELSTSGERPLLIGGGVGVPPMYRLAKELIALGKKVTVILGFNTKEEIFYEDEFRALGADVILATADGSRGVKGFVTDAMRGLDYTYFYCCGPEPMLRAVYRESATGGQFSFEERMGCGFGACMGCSIMTANGPKRICRDGPVLTKEEILWEN